MCLAIPGRVMSLDYIDGFTIIGMVDFDGVVSAVNLSFLPETRIDDYVIVHVGFGISRLDQNTAQQMTAALRQVEHL